MSIDTRYVAIEPKFDVKAFNDIKKKFEELGSNLSSIPVGYKFNSTSLTGLKTAIRTEITEKDYKIKVPVTYNLTQSSLTGLKTELSTMIGKASIIARIPTRFDLKGARKDLTEQLKTMFITQPIKIPVNIALTGVDRTGTDYTDSRTSGGRTGRSSNFGSRVVGAGVTSAAFGIGGGAVYGTANAIRSGAGSVFDLETNLLYMKSVYDATIGGISTEKMDAIRKKTLETAAALPVTVSDASDAMRILAKNGASADNILSGMFDEAVIASLALRTNVGITADFMTDQARTFELQAHEFDRVSKTLVGTTFASKFDVNDVWYGFAAGAGVAQQAKLSIEEYGALLVTAQATAKSGRDLGTQLKNLIRFFTIPKSKKSAEMMQKYGLNAFDDKGNLLNAKEWVKQLTKLNDLSDEKRLAAVNEIFGSDASKGAGELLKSLEAYTKNLDIIMNAKPMSAVETQMSGLDGAIKLITSKWQDLFNAMFDEKTIARISEWLKGIAEKIGAMSEAFKRLGGLSGIWDNIIDDEVKTFLTWMLNTIRDIAFVIGKLVGIDAELLVEKANAARSGYTVKREVVEKVVPGGLKEYGGRITQKVTTDRFVYEAIKSNVEDQKRVNPLLKNLLATETLPSRNLTTHMSPVPIQSSRVQNINFNGPVNEPEKVVETINRANTSFPRDNDASYDNRRIFLGD